MAELYCSLNFVKRGYNTSSNMVQYAFEGTILIHRYLLGKTLNLIFTASLGVVTISVSNLDIYRGRDIHSFPFFAKQYAVSIAKSPCKVLMYSKIWTICM